jgi:hypothetical protein
MLGQTDSSELNYPEQETIYIAGLWRSLGALVKLTPQNYQQAIQASHLDPQLEPKAVKLSRGEYLELSLAEQKALGEMVCLLCQQHRELIRRAVALLEQMINQNDDPWQTTLLGKYRDRLHRLHPKLTTDQVTGLAERNLIALLFYSSTHGTQRLQLCHNITADR